VTKDHHHKKKISRKTLKKKLQNSPPPLLFPISNTKQNPGKTGFSTIASAIINRK